MSVIHLHRQNGAYKASVGGCKKDWCYGYGLTWEAAVVDLLRSFKSTLGLDFTIEPPVSRPEPLDGMAAENAREVDQTEALVTIYKQMSDAQDAEMAANFQIP